MRARGFLRFVAVSGFSTSLLACATAGDETNEPAKDDPSEDVTRSVAAFPEAEVVQAADDGVPTFVRGVLGKIGETQADDRVGAEAAMRPVLNGVLAPFRLTASDVRLRKLNVDESGNRHFRYTQVFDGLEVVGGDLAIHVDVKGTVFAINGNGRGDLPSTLGKRDVGPDSAVSRVTKDLRFLGMSAAQPRSVYIILPDGAMHKAYEIVVTGERGLDPARDKVYVSVDTGEVVAVHPQIHFAENRKVYSAGNGTSLPGTLKRSEGAAATSDVDVNAAYDNTGATYEAYKSFFNRDSYNNAGAALISTVHYNSNYCNAFWDGTQMVYGDGNGTDCLPLARAVDVTAHELTHAVTENESGLVYSGESGGLNEAMSDIFGAFAEAWVDGGKNGTLAISTDTYLVGEDILPPALRYMADPAADGASLDYWTSSAGSVDVHYSSGIANLAFYLLSQGGKHPRGKSTNLVAGIGMDKAIRIFYLTNTNYLTSSSNYAAMRTATLSAAAALGYTTAEQTAVGDAWTAVGVVGATPPAPAIDLTNGTPVTGIAGAKDSQKFYKITVPAGATNLTFVISGGTGDADLYTKSGAQPTLTTYDCRPYASGNAETCTVAAPVAGTYYAMLNAYATYSGVTLKASYTTGGGGGGDDGVPVLANGVPVTGLSGATSSSAYYKITTPAGKRLVISISGGTGDADLYTRAGSKPTTTTYTCRPYLTGNGETCTVTSTAATTYYVMLKGYAAYAGVTLKGSY